MHFALTANSIEFHAQEENALKCFACRPWLLLLVMALALVEWQLRLGAMFGGAKFTHFIDGPKLDNFTSHLYALARK